MNKWGLYLHKIWYCVIKTKYFLEEPPIFLPPLVLLASGYTYA